MAAGPTTVGVSWDGDRRAGSERAWRSQSGGCGTRPELDRSELMAAGVSRGGSRAGYGRARASERRR